MIQRSHKNAGLNLQMLGHNSKYIRRSSESMNFIGLRLWSLVSTSIGFMIHYTYYYVYETSRVHLIHLWDPMY